MAIGQLALTALLTVTAPAEPVLLTPDTIRDHGFHLQCFVADTPDKVAGVREAPVLRPKGSMVVKLRFGLIQKGPFAVSANDLDAITGVCLVVRESDGIKLSIPLQTKVDPGNEIHLYTHFSTERDLLTTTDLVFDVLGESGQRTFIVPLKEFIKEK